MEQKDTNYNSLSEKQRRLFELRLKVNQCRKENSKFIYEEEKRANEPKNADYKREKLREEEEKEKEKEQLKQQGTEKQMNDFIKMKEGLDPEHEELLTVTASDAEYLEKKKKNKEKNRSASFGWEQYNEQSQFKSYERRIRETGIDKAEYDKMKETMAPDEFYRDANSLLVGSAPNLPKENIDKMVNELDKHIAKRRSFSRKRGNPEDAFVDYINDRNKQFNMKISRAYDKYTEEIRQNLERGTAL